MASDVLPIAALLFLFNCIKYIVFGIGHFDSTVTHFTQFVVINLMLHAKSTPTSRMLSDFATWAFFGLSPHDNTAPTLEYLLSDGEITDGSNPTVFNSSHLHGRRMLDLNETKAAIEPTVDWVNDNKFLLSIMILTAFIAVSIVVNIIYHALRRGVLSINCCSNRKHSDSIDFNRRGFNYIVSNYHTTNYTSFFIKVLLLCYCNLCTITNSQFVYLGDSIPVTFMVLVVAFFFELGFPFFIVYKLNKFSANLYSPHVTQDYGPLYERFRDSPKTNKFIVVVLINQLVYSILINVSEHLSVTQNSLLIATNLVFAIALLGQAPYKDNLLFYQAVMTSVSTLLISSFNYAIIIEDTSDKIKQAMYIASVVVHVLTFGSFFIFQIVRYHRNRSTTKFVDNSAESGGVEMVKHRNPLFHDSEFIAQNPQRLWNEIHGDKKAST